MTRVNYSKDVLLIDEEILDYDTINHNETGINGEYIVSKVTIPLTYNGTTSITATKAVDRIY